MAGTSLRDLVELAIVVDPTYDQNCYVLHRRDTQCVLVVDPGLQHERTLELICAMQLSCDLVLLTHGHPDHVSGVPYLRQEFACTVAMHPDDIEQLSGLHMLPGVPDDLPDVVIDQHLRDGQVLRWQGMDIAVMHTPGHTRGSACFRIGADLLSGDTLFHRGVGRCDLPGGSMPALTFSLQHKVYALPPDTVVYPGHGQRTTIAEEMELNPFVVHPRHR